MVDIPGIVLTSGTLRARIVDNSPRFSHLADSAMEGMSGVAALMHDAQRKSVFSDVGLNYECANTDPPTGQRRDAWNAPRLAPMDIEQVDDATVRLTQNAAEASGLNIVSDYRLADPYLDHTFTIWPDHDIRASGTFWASYMNQVQNTSLFLRARLDGDVDQRWYEATSVGHSGDGKVRYRPFDPSGKTWHEHLQDNPLLRQDITQTDESRVAAEAAGFRARDVRAFGGFFYGLVDDFILLYIFREPDFRMWMSASGSIALRNPAWDYATSGGPQRAGERRTYHARVVYKPFAGVEDVLREVAAFRGAATRL